MLNKLHFNNLVISHKKRIQRARSETINKFVQKIRKLKQLLEKKPEDKKTKERLCRATEHIEELKAMKRVDIMRKVLLLNTKASAVLTNGRASSEEIAVAMLAINRNMTELIKLFREELKLSEKDEMWRAQICEVSKRRAKIERTEEKKRKRKQLKDLKAMEHNRKDWLEQNQTSSLETIENNDAQGLSSCPDVQPQSGELCLDERANEKPFKSASENTKKKQQDAKDKIKKPKKHKTCDNGHMKMDISESSQHHEVEIMNNEVTHTEDPFFITDTGENYLSTAVVLPDQHIDSEDDSQPSYKPNATYTGNYRRPAKQRQGRDSYTRRTPGENDDQITAVKRQPYKLKAGSDKSKSIIFADKAESDTNLVKRAASSCVHPSWVAKQKLKPKIAAFQGTKIKFDQD